MDELVAKIRTVKISSEASGGIFAKVCTSENFRYTVCNSNQTEARFEELFFKLPLILFEKVCTVASYYYLTTV